MSEGRSAKRCGGKNFGGVPFGLDGSGDGFVRAAEGGTVCLGGKAGKCMMQLCFETLCMFLFGLRGGWLVFNLLC